MKSKIPSLAGRGLLAVALVLGLAAAEGSGFCRKQAEAVIGGALGLWVAGQPAAAGWLEPDAAKGLKIRGNLSQRKQGSRRKLSPGELQA